MNIKKKKKNWIKFIIFIILVFLLLCISSVYLFINYKTNKIDNTLLYNEKGQLSYLVCLNENNIIKDECISEKRSFISELINKIKFKFDYELEASDIADYNYSYEIVGETIINEKASSDKILYKDKKILGKNNYNKKNQNKIIINDDFNINYDEYNKIVTNFKKQYPVEIDGNLIITINININGKREDIIEEIKNNYDLKIIIPLGNDTTEIKDFITTIENNGSINNYKKTKEGYTLFSLLCDIVYKLDILYVIFVLVFIFKIMPKMSGYNLELKKVLKEYDKMIVNVNSMPELNDLQVMEVSNFSELVDAKKNLNKPIMYFDNYDKNEVIFVVKSDSDAFVYIMNKYDK